MLTDSKLSKLEVHGLRLLCVCVFEGVSLTSCARYPRTQGCPSKASPASASTPRGQTAWSRCSSISKCLMWDYSSLWSFFLGKHQSMVKRANLMMKHSNSQRIWHCDSEVVLCLSSGSEACGRYSVRNGYSVRSGEECGENIPSDTVQSLSEDQCQTRGHQQCAGATSKVGFGLGSFMMS